MRHNLAELTADERADIERDKQRWHQALNITLSRRPAQIRQWLATINDTEEKEDWRQRLNTLRRQSPFK